MNQRNLDYLLWLLSNKEYPEKALRRKLKLRKVEDADADELIDFLKEKDYLSDKRFKAARASELVRRGEGPRSIQQKINREAGSNINEDSFEDVYERLNTDSKEVLEKFLEKEYSKLLRGKFADDKYKIKQKLIERAARRGHDLGEVFNVSARIIEHHKEGIN